MRLIGQKRKRIEGNTNKCIDIVCCCVLFLFIITPFRALASDAASNSDTTTQQSTQEQLAQIERLQRIVREQTSLQLPKFNQVTLPPKGQQDVQQKPPQQQRVTAEDAEDALLQQLAFKQLTKNLFPMSPEQINKLRKRYEKNEYATNAPTGTPPRPVASSKMVDLAPGSTPPVIRLSQGFVSSVLFLDSTGAPWPIQDYDLGDPGTFNIQWDRKGNILMIQANKLYTYGNLAVRLRGLPTPIMLTLVPGQKAVDYRIDLRVQGVGPNAKLLPTQTLPGAASPILLGVLDGVAPAGSQLHPVLGGEAQAWVMAGKLFLRTRLTVLSPGWVSKMTSADGTHAYEMQPTSMLLVADHGKVMQLRIEGL